MRNVPPENSLVERHHKGGELHLLREIIRTYQTLMSGFSRKVGMPASRFALIRILANAAPAEIGVMDLARQLGINAAAVTRQINAMEQERLVVKRPDAKDGRRCGVKLSPRGLKAFEEIHERGHELEERLSSIISPVDIKTTVKVLKTLRNFLEKANRQEAEP